MLLKERGKRDIRKRDSNDVLLFFADSSAVQIQSLQIESIRVKILHKNARRVLQSVKKVLYL